MSYNRRIDEVTNLDCIYFSIGKRDCLTIEIENTKPYESIFQFY